MIKSKLSSNRLVLLIIFLCLISIIIVLSVLLVLEKQNTTPDGMIIYRALLRANAFESDLPPLDYYIMDGNGNQIQSLWNYRGSPSWSSDGNYVAVSCEDDVSQLCILDMTTIPNWSIWPPKDEYVRIPPLIDKKFDLPEECNNLVSQYYGLESISWSHDGNKIAVVCGVRDATRGTEGIKDNSRIVCILEFNTGQTNCWNGFPFDIYQAYWSPVEDILVVSKDTDNLKEFELHLVGPQGIDPVFVANGIAPAWSPDGNHIAFMTNLSIEGGDNISGIAVVNKDGSGFRWLMQNPEENIWSFDSNCSYGCKLSWSPDGKYIVFQGDQTSYGYFNLFRLDVKTGDILCLSCSDNENVFFSLPDWGPPIPGR